MKDWYLRLQTVGVLPGFPAAFTVAEETRRDASYHLSGKTRGGNNHCLFQYTLSGEGVFENSAGAQRVPAGSGFLCEACAPDSVYYYRPGETRPWRFLFFCFGGEVSYKLVRSMAGRHGPVWRLPQSDPVMRRLLAMGGNFERGGDAVEALACGPAPVATPLASRREISQAENALLVMQLLAALLREREEESRGSPASSLVRRAMEMADERIEGNLNVSRLAALLSVSREHLTRVFREQTGQSPHQYLIRQKMTAACDLLKDSRLSIKEIASRLGFESSAHFSRAFRACLGETPRDFRESGHIPVI